MSEDEGAVETNGFCRKLVFGWNILHSSVKAMSVSCGIFFIKKFKSANIVFCIAWGRLYNTKYNVICIKGSKFNPKINVKVPLRLLVCYLEYIEVFLFENHKQSG